MRGTLLLIRGIPGSGKSTLAKAIVPSDRHFEADKFFYLDGIYKFDERLLGEAHQWCMDQVHDAIELANRSSSPGTVVVSNTFSQVWEMRQYVKMAERNHWNLSVIKVVGSHPNIHGVPASVIDKMRERWEDYGFEITVESCGLNNPFKTRRA